MALVTVRVLEGLERGRVFSHLATPVSIGREADNDIQLNDDRVSRFHAKLQDDSGKIILTDLESTNGTRVNGHPIQIRILQTGDLVSIGRCVLLFGDPPGWTVGGEAGATALFPDDAQAFDPSDVDFLEPPPGISDEPGRLFPLGAPPLPQGLRTLHRAQLSDLLAYMHERLGDALLRAVEVSAVDQSRQMMCPWGTWQELVGLQAAVTSYLRLLSDPDEADKTPNSGFHSR